MWVEMILIWLKRATGIGYEEFPLLDSECHEQTEKIKEKANQVQKDVELLERELRRVLVRYRYHS